jgi:hypothetical protein
MNHILTLYGEITLAAIELRNLGEASVSHSLKQLTGEMVRG